MHVMDHYSRRNGKKNSQVRQIWRRNNEHILFKKMVKENDRLKEKTKNKKKEIKKSDEKYYVVDSVVKAICF